MATHRGPTRPDLPQALTDRLLDEGVLRLIDAAALEGVSVAPKVLIRWCVHGVRGAKLESVVVGGRRLTSRAAFRRFVAAQQRNVQPAVAAIDVAGADAVLAAHGLKREVRQ